LGNQLYSAEDYAIRIIDVTAPVTPVTLGLLAPANGLATSVAALGTTLFVTEGFNLSAVNAIRPTTPLYYASIPVDGQARHVALAGELLYVAADTAGLRVLEIRDPKKPVVVGQYPTRQAYSSTLTTSNVFVADMTDGLYVFQLPVCGN
jgi:hypothetical protein